MASEGDLAERGTSSPAASTSQVSWAARPGASENLRCPICRAAINDRNSVSWRCHPFCFYCMVEWFHRRVEGLICQSPSPNAFQMVGDSNSEVHCIGEAISSASHTQGEQAGSCSPERCQHHSSRCQHRKSYRSRGGSHGGSRGGSRGRAQDYNSRNRRQRQSRAQNTARNRGAAPRTKRHVHGLSRRRKHHQQYQVSFIEPRAVRSRSRQRSRSSSSRTLREYLRKMERDEGRALRQDWYIRATSGRSRRQQQRHRVSYREPQATRSRTPGRFCSTMPLKENPRRMEHYERQPLRTEQGIHTSPRRSERLQQGSQASFTESPVTRSQSQGRYPSTHLQTLRENLRTERHDRQAPSPERDIPTSSGWSERRKRRHRISFTEPEVARN